MSLLRWVTVWAGWGTPSGPVVTHQAATVRHQLGTTAAFGMTGTTARAHTLGTTAALSLRFEG